MVYRQAAGVARVVHGATAWPCDGRSVQVSTRRGRAESERALPLELRHGGEVARFTSIIVVFELLDAAADSVSGPARLLPVNARARCPAFVEELPIHVVRYSAEEAARTEVTWQIHNDRGHQYLLTNVGTGSAFNVALDYAGVLDVNSETDEVKPQGQLRFMAFATSGGTDQTITVTYSESPDGDRLTWAVRKPGRGH